MELFEMGGEDLEVKEQSELGEESLEEKSLEPELMDVPGIGEVLVGGNPFEIGEKLDDHQGDNFYNFQGDCGLVTVLNMLTMAGIETNEDEVVGRAIILGKCGFSEDNEPENNGGTSVFDRRALLESYGISSYIFDSKNHGGNPEAVASYVEAGYGVNISLNCGYAWNRPEYIQDGTSNHSVIVTGTARDKVTGELKGVFVCDSGLVNQDSKAYFLPIDVLNQAYVDVPGSSALVTSKPIR